MIEFIGAFLLWTLLAYALHRAAHHPLFSKTLWPIHAEHHALDHMERPKFPAPTEFFFWFGTWRRSADVWITQTIPAIIAVAVFGGYAWLILPLHYVYEVFLADGMLDHNPAIKGRITQWMTIGSMHLRHHTNYKTNYGFYITLWDRLFGSYRGDEPARERVRPSISPQSVPS
ncbi:MAG: sterol desaturase family protein [Bdellovibrionales bacterium]